LTDTYDIPPGHDATVVSDEPFQAIEFASARVFAVPADGDRVLAGDAMHGYCGLDRAPEKAGRLRMARSCCSSTISRRAWSSNRFRGREIQTTGDGFMAMFDGPARAVRCAQAIGSSIARLGIESPRRHPYRRGRISRRKCARSCRPRNRPHRGSCKGGRGPRVGHYQAACSLDRTSRSNPPVFTSSKASASHVSCSGLQSSV